MSGEWGKRGRERTSPHEDGGKLPKGEGERGEEEGEKLMQNYYESGRKRGRKKRSEFIKVSFPRKFSCSYENPSLPSFLQLLKISLSFS